MSPPKKIFVTGVTGNQGGSVLRDLLNNGFYVKALVRNPAAAKFAANDRLEIIKGDLNDPASYQDHLQNVDGVFCILSYDYGIDKEIKQGIALIDVSRQNNVKHFLYSSVIGCDLHTGIPHWESKFKIETYLKSAGMNYTVIRPPSFFENLLLPQVRKRIIKGKLVLPTRKHKTQQFSSAEDVGKVALIIFSNPEEYNARIIHFAAEQMHGEEIATRLSNVMGKQIKFQQLPALITRLALGRDLAKMFRWVNNNDVLFADINISKKEFPGLLDFESWAKRHFA